MIKSLSTSTADNELKSVQTNKIYSREQRTQVVALYLDGKKPSEISSLTGINISCVYNWTKRRYRKSVVSHKDSESSNKKYKKEPAFKRLHVEGNLGSLQNNQDKDLIQILSPQGFKMLVPSHQTQILSLFFQ